MKPLRPWILAARPKTLTAAIIPFLTGAALAYRVEGIFSWDILSLCLACSLLIQIATNLINDALDCKRGGDTERRLGPVRVCHAGMLTINEVLCAGIACLLLSGLLGIPLLFRGGPELSALFGVSLLCAYAYSGGPFAISLNGLGELFSFLFFGIAATAASYYLQAQQWSFEAFVLGGQIGFLTASIAAINNYRDMKEDALTGKKTLAVSFGPAFAEKFIAILLLSPYALGGYWIGNGHVLAALLPLAVLPLGGFLVYKIYTTSPSRQYNTLLGLSALHHLLFGILFIAALLT